MHAYTAWRLLTKYKVFKWRSSKFIAIVLQRIPISLWTSSGRAMCSFWPAVLLIFYAYIGTIQWKCSEFVFWQMFYVKLFQFRVFFLQKNYTWPGAMNFLNCRTFSCKDSNWFCDNWCESTRWKIVCNRRVKVMFSNMHSNRMDFLLLTPTSMNESQI